MPDIAPGFIEMFTLAEICTENVIQIYGKMRRKACAFYFIFLKRTMNAFQKGTPQID